MARTAKRRPGPPHVIELPDLAAFQATPEDHGDYEALDIADRDLARTEAKGATFARCRFVRCRLDDARLPDGRMTECLLDELGATGVDVSGSTWHDTILAGARIGALSAVRAQWSSVRVRGGKLDFLALAGARLDDVAFEDCVIDELDLGDARLKAVTFSGCRIGVLDVEAAQMTDVDLAGAQVRTVRGIASLRGATVSPGQLVEMAPLMAHHLGIRVGDET